MKKKNEKIKIDPHKRAGEMLEPNIRQSMMGSETSRILTYSYDESVHKYVNVEEDKNDDRNEP